MHGMPRRGMTSGRRRRASARMKGVNCSAGPSSARHPAHADQIAEAKPQAVDAPLNRDTLSDASERQARRRECRYTGRCRGRRPGDRRLSLRALVRAQTPFGFRPPGHRANQAADRSSTLAAEVQPAKGKVRPYVELTTGVQSATQVRPPHGSTSCRHRRARIRDQPLTYRGRHNELFSACFLANQARSPCLRQLRRQARA